MGMRLLMYLGILVIGGVFSYKDVFGKKIHGKLDIIQTICLLFLLFIMGVRIGLDDKVISSFLKLGFQALIISIFSIAFSVILVKLVKGFIVKNEEKVGAENEY
ncbi:LysO family transporter [Clostridiisalibacter paucivorans]|uniref:LysO family transporter n=1 Tax=Clostridiisalibacter paucivorans TaxID=408753 RepID=UPI00068823D2|nr:LysO family transporter [Clostridiisalibacter paucivorans]